MWYSQVSGWDRSAGSGTQMGVRFTHSTLPSFAHSGAIHAHVMHPPPPCGLHRPGQPSSQVGRTFHQDCTLEVGMGEGVGQASSPSPQPPLQGREKARPLTLQSPKTTLRLCPCSWMPGSSLLPGASSGPTQQGTGPR
jgi:hypothetical protein